MKLNYKCQYCLLLATFLVIVSAGIEAPLAAGLLDDTPGEPGQFRQTSPLAAAGADYRPAGTSRRLTIAIMPFSESRFHGFSMPSGAVENSFSAALARTGRFRVVSAYAVQGPYAERRRPDIEIHGRILDFTMDGTDFYTSVTGDDGRRHRRMYSHTTIDARLEIEISAVETATGRVIGTGRAWSADSETFSGFPGGCGPHDSEPGYFMGGTGGRRYNYSMSWSNRWDGTSRLVANLIEDVVAARRGSLTRWVLDRFPLVGKVVSISSAGDFAWIDLGSDDGVAGRDRFVVMRGGVESAILRVASLSARSSKVSISYDRKMRATRPGIGDTVVSRGW